MFWIPDVFLWRATASPRFSSLSPSFYQLFFDDVFKLGEATHRAERCFWHGIMCLALASPSSECVCGDNPCICRIWNLLESVCFVLHADWVCNLKHIVSNTVTKQRREWHDCFNPDWWFWGNSFLCITRRWNVLFFCSNTYAATFFLLLGNNRDYEINECRCLLWT